MNIKVILVILGFCLLGCREAEEGAPVVMSGLMGSWQGIIKNISADGEQVIDISLNLEANRNFTLKKARSREQATGTYDEFPQLSSLTLRVEESDAVELVQAGGILDFEYELYDGELLLNSKTSLLRLKRPEAGNKDALNSLWACTQGESQWQLSFVDSQFILYSENEGGASLFVKGSFNAEPMESESNEQRMAMFVEDAQPIKLFQQLNGLLVYEQDKVVEIQLTPYSLDGKQLDNLECLPSEETTN